MHELHIRRIKTVLHKEFDSLIDLTDVEARSDVEKENHFLTRSQAALALAYATDLDREKAASSVVDGFDDNGIDAIYYDKDMRTVYIVQSKWISGKKGLDLGSIEKFISGFKDFLAARFERFNKKIIEQQQVLEKALDSYDVEFLLIFVHTSTQPLSEHIERKLNDLIEEVNDPIDVVSYRIYNQKDIYSAISGTLEDAAISIEVTLYDWGQIREPYQAFYGQVSAEEIARWYREYESRLFARNLRKFKGDTEVNRVMKATLLREPAKFWYFNNGITVLCSRLKKKPIGGANRDTGQFICEGISVVNGAQTVGNIATSVSQGFAKAKDARVLVRFISLENCPEDFGIEVTTATNTQNRIEFRDFASLDPTQERLKTDLLLDLNKSYVYRSGEHIPSKQDGCDIDEATVALACAHPRIQLSTEAKRKISVLWEDIKKPPYTRLFNEKLTALRLWRSVEVLRIVEEVLMQEQRTRDGVAWRVAIHGNRFILHRVFQILPLEKFDQLEFEVQSLKPLIIDETLKALDQIVEVINEEFSDTYLNNFFKSASKCIKLVEYLPKLPPLQHIPYFSVEGDDRQTSLLQLIK